MSSQRFIDIFNPKLKASGAPYNKYEVIDQDTSKLLLTATLRNTKKPEIIITVTPTVEDMYKPFNEIEDAILSRMKTSIDLIETPSK